MSEQLIAEWIKEIISHPYVTLGLILLALFSFILMIVFYFRSKRFKRLYYSIKSNNIIKDFTSKFDSLEISIGGKNVEHLTATQVIIWNGGKDTIRKNDITKIGPLEIVLKEAIQILDTKILAINNPANEISIRKIDSQKGKSSLQLYFEYLDMNDGCVIQIIHDGYSPDDLILTGTIIGAGKPREKTILYGKLFKFLPFKAQMQYAILFIFSFFLGTFASGFFLTSVSSGERFMAVILWICSLLLFIFYLDYRKKRVPKGLEIFQNIE